MEEHPHPVVNRLMQDRHRYVRYAEWISGNRGFGDDVVNQLAEHLIRYGDPAKVPPGHSYRMVFKMLRRIWIRMNRNTEHQMFLKVADIDEEEWNEPSRPDPENWVHLGEVLSMMDPVDAKIMLMSAMGFKYADIAEEMGIKTSFINYTISRVRNSLAEHAI